MIRMNIIIAIISITISIIQLHNYHNCIYLYIQLCNYTITQLSWLYMCTLIQKHNYTIIIIIQLCNYTVINITHVIIVITRLMIQNSSRAIFQNLQLDLRLAIAALWYQKAEGGVKNSLKFQAVTAYETFQSVIYPHRKESHLPTAIFQRIY